MKRQDREEMMAQLSSWGIADDDIPALRRISKTLNQWGKLTPSRKAGVMERLDAIMANYPHLIAFFQAEPREPALYILRSIDVPAGEPVGPYYRCGIGIQ